MRDELLREHVAAIRGVGLAVDGERGRAGERLHRDRRRGALLVVAQRPGLQQRLRGRDPWARTPRRGRRRWRAARGPTADWPPAPRRPRPTPPRRPCGPGATGPHGATTISAAATRQPLTICRVRLQPEAGNHDEAGGKRSRHRADGVHGVHGAEAAGDVGRRGPGYGERQRKRRAEADRRRQDQRRGERRAAQHPVADAGGRGRQSAGHEEGHVAPRPASRCSWR